MEGPDLEVDTTTSSISISSESTVTSASKLVQRGLERSQGSPTDRVERLLKKYKVS